MITAALSQLLQAIPQARLVGEDVSFTGAGIDTRTLRPGNLFIAIRGERFDGHDFVGQAVEQGAVALVVEEPSECNCPQLIVPDTRSALGAIAAWWRFQVKPTVVAVTGSNGKTTTKEMLAKIFSVAGKTMATQGNFNNDIGVPLTLMRLESTDRFAVIEIGANHHGEIAEIVPWVRPDVALITMIGPCHLEGFGSLEGVAKAKSEIFSTLGEQDAAIIPSDDAFAAVLAANSGRAKRVFFGEGDQSDLRIDCDGESVVFLANGEKAELSLQLQGRHNIQNAAAAAAAALAAGVSLDQVMQGLAAVRSVKGRLQLRPEILDYLIIDDTYNANPASFRAAIDTLASAEEKTCLVMGDMGELGGDEEVVHEEVGQYARVSGIDFLFALGEWSFAAVRGFGSGGSHAESINNLVEEFMRVVPPGTRVVVKGSRFMRMERFIESLEQHQPCHEERPL